MARSRCLGFFVLFCFNMKELSTPDTKKVYIPLRNKTWSLTHCLLPYPPGSFQWGHEEPSFSTHIHGMWTVACDIWKGFSDLGDYLDGFVSCCRPHSMPSLWSIYRVDVGPQIVTRASKSILSSGLRHMRLSLCSFWLHSWVLPFSITRAMTFSGILTNTNSQGKL